MYRPPLHLSVAAAVLMVALSVHVAAASAPVPPPTVWDDAALDPEAEQPILLTATAPDGFAPPSGRDITKDTGLWDGHDRGWYGSFPADWNSDGDMDVLIAPHGGTRFFMQNDGNGVFTEILHRTIPPDDRHGCAWGDPNLDTRPDLYCTIGAHHGTQRKANELFMQQADGSFVDRATAMGVEDPFGRGRDAGWLMANGDQWPDLYVSNQYPRHDNKPTRNKLFLSNGGTNFHRAPKFGVDINGGAAINVHGCVVTDDYNGDGWDDLLTCGTNGLVLWHNDHGHGFTQVTRTLGVRQGICYQAHFVDMNGDGRLDLVGVMADGLFIQFGVQHRFGSAWVRHFDQGRQVAVGDVNGDGASDLYVVRAAGNNGNLPDLMLVNHGSGRAFSLAPFPQIRRAIGDTASMIDIDGDGHDEIIVTHGGEHHRGPLQALSFTPV